jgi:hypothetical protein
MPPMVRVSAGQEFGDVVARAGRGLFEPSACLASRSEWSLISLRRSLIRMLSRRAHPSPTASGTTPAAIGALLPGPGSWRTLLKRSGGKTLGLSPSWPRWALSPSPPTACSPGPGDEHASRLTPTPSTWMRGRVAKDERSVYEVGATRRVVEGEAEGLDRRGGPTASAGGSRSPPPQVQRCCFTFEDGRRRTLLLLPNNTEPDAFRRLRVR